MTNPSQSKQVSLPDAIQQAVTLHRQGRLDDAERLYTTILQAKNNHFDALHLLGVLMHQRGRSADALALIAKAIETNAHSADAHANFGRVLAALGRLDEAIASFDRALALKPDHVEALFHRSNALMALGRPMDALAGYDRVVALIPNYAQAHINRGVALRALKRPGEALLSYDRALALKSDAAEAYANRGNALLDLGRSDEALVCYAWALAIQPGNVDALYNQGNALLKMKRAAEALASYDRALAIAPGHANVLVNRSTALRALKRPDEALVSIDRALAIGVAEASEAHNGRGMVLSDLNRPGEALACFNAALAIRPDDAEIEINRGNMLMDLRCIDEALASCEAVLARDPDNPDAHWNRGLIHLALGDFTQGWPDYEWRAKKKEDNDVRRFTGVRWTGAEPIFGKTVLLHAEQGFGDTIQFIRYAPLVAAKGANIVVEAPDSLRPLITDLTGVSTVISRNESTPAFDLHCPLLSLPLAFGTTLQTVPVDVPYLRAPAERVERWRGRIPEGGTLRIGLAWSGNPTHVNDRNRSIPLTRLSALLSDPRLAIVSLQRDIKDSDRRTLEEYPHVIPLGLEFADFGDTAAVVSLLDLVISVDTSVAHLAGAMGKPVWILLPFNGDWRWMLEGEQSPWYPTARLFRQPVIGDWDRALERVQDALAEWTHSLNGRTR
jgi:tetratricopeptide (TPR) repeat protein